MKPSAAFAAWCDGERVQVERRGEWHDVHWFSHERHGLSVWHSNTVGVIRSPVSGRVFRLADTPTEPKPTVEDSEAWGLLRDFTKAFCGLAEAEAALRDSYPNADERELSALRAQKSLRSGLLIAAMREAKDALKKRGML